MSCHDKQCMLKILASSARSLGRLDVFLVTDQVDLVLPVISAEVIQKVLDGNDMKIDHLPGHSAMGILDVQKVSEMHYRQVFKGLRDCLLPSRNR